MAKFYLQSELNNIQIDRQIVKRIFKFCEYGDLKRLVQAFRELKAIEKIKLLSETNKNNLTFACVAAKYSRFNILKYCFEFYNKIDSLKSRDMLSDALKTAVKYQKLIAIKCILKILTANERSFSCNELIL